MKLSCKLNVICVLIEQNKRFSLSNILPIQLQTHAWRQRFDWPKLWWWCVFYTWRGVVRYQSLSYLTWLLAVFFFFSFVFAKSAFCEFDSFDSRHCRRRIYTSNDQSQKAQTTDSMLCTYIWWCFNTFIDLQQTSQFVLNAIEQRKKRIIRIVDWLFFVSYCRLIQLLKGGLKNMSQIHNDHGS